jgi:hypothetical protein
MCLRYNSMHVKETNFLKTKPKVYRYCYKRYKIKKVNQNRINFISPHLGNVNSFPGIIMSDALDDYNYPISHGTVDKGIHVYTKEATAIDKLGFEQIVVKLKCYNKDLIMLGYNDEAVYDRVEMEYDEYRRLLKKLLRRKK